MVAELSQSDRDWWIRADGYEDDEDPKAHEKVLRVIQAISREQDRKREFLLWGAMYAGGVPPAGGGMAVDAYVRTTPRGRSNLSLNLSRTVVDAVVSRVFAKAKPVLKYATEGGGPEHQEMARQMTRGIEGGFYQCDAADKFIDQGRDGTVFGSGHLRIDADHNVGKVTMRRWFPWERIVDDGESFYDGKPRSFYSQHYYDRHDVCSMVARGVRGWVGPDDDEQTQAYKASEVERLKGEKDEDAEFGFQQVASRVWVREAWRRPSHPGGKDGRYVKAVTNCTLIDMPWDGESDPFTDFFWSKPLLGFYGQGIVELGQGKQAEINKMVRQFQTACHMIAGKWLVANGSGVVSAHINNSLDTILKYNAPLEPKYIVPSVIDPQFVAHLHWLCDEYLRETGITEQAAMGSIPAGMKSGEAQREYAQQQSETLLEKGQRYEKAVQDAGEAYARAAREIAKANGGVYEVRSFADDSFDTIDWGELDDPDGMELVVSPTSSLPGTIAGKVDLAYDLMQIGDYDAADIEDIVGIADVMQRTNLKRASAKLVMKRVGAMLTRGEPWAPPSYINLPEAKIIAQQMLCLAEERDVEDERLDLVRQFVVQVDARAKQGQAAAPPPPQAMLPGGPMLGPGAAPPVLPGAGVPAGPPAAPGPTPANPVPTLGAAA